MRVPQGETVFRERGAVPGANTLLFWVFGLRSRMPPPSQCPSAGETGIILAIVASLVLDSGTTWLNQNDR